jgi:hypothetical protein
MPAKASISIALHYKIQFTHIECAYACLYDHHQFLHILDSATALLLTWWCVYLDANAMLSGTSHIVKLSYTEC